MYGPDPDANAGFFAAGAGAGRDSLMVTVTETDPARYARAPDAARAYDVASRKLNRPDRQKLNFPRGGDLGSGARARPGATDSDYAARRDAPHR
jgi:hypothetical protein